MKGDVTVTDIRCPFARQHKSDKNVMLLRTADGELFCALHGDFPTVEQRVAAMEVAALNETERVRPVRGHGVNE